MLGYLVYGIHACVWGVSRLVRRFVKTGDYAVLLLEGEYPDCPEPPGKFPFRLLHPPKPSLHAIADHLRLITDDRHLRGVVLHVRELALAPAQLDTLRSLIGKLRHAGKRVVVWSYTYSRDTYYLASAADEILLLPGGSVEPLGFFQRHIFLAEALAELGLHADLVPIAPYKSAGDVFTRTRMSDEAREMTSWLADAAQIEMTSAVAQGRNMGREAAEALMDRAPCTDQKAVEQGLVDSLVYEDDLPAHLKKNDQPAHLVTWNLDKQYWHRRRPRRPGRYIVLLSIHGLIVNGYSRRSPFGRPPIPILCDHLAGDLSITQVVRRIMADRRAAGVVVHVDSPGGSATASEAIRSSLAHLAARKPLVVVMGAAAASGGYLVSTPARHILAQPNTVTGSIGVLGGKFTVSRFLDRLLIHRETVRRGKFADFHDPEMPYNEEARTILWESLERTYQLFLDQVADSRKLSLEAVRAVADGRVWAGRQALNHGLVDELGGLREGLAKARELAALSSDAQVRMLTPDKSHHPPSAESESGVTHGLQVIRALARVQQFYLCPITLDRSC